MKARRFWNTVPQAMRVAAFAVLSIAIVIGIAVPILVKNGPPLGPVVAPLMGLAIGGFVAIWLSCLGYVYADARRRGMPPWLWVLIAILVPNLLGFLLYFALRRPLVLECAHCHRAMLEGQRFCAWCGSARAGNTGGAPGAWTGLDPGATV